jgi:hypothetical protein
LTLVEPNVDQVTGNNLKTVNSWRLSLLGVHSFDDGLIFSFLRLAFDSGSAIDHWSLGGARIITLNSLHDSGQTLGYPIGDWFSDVCGHLVSHFSEKARGLVGLVFGHFD